MSTAIDSRGRALAPVLPAAGGAGLTSRAWRLLNMASVDAIQGQESRCRTYAADAGTLAAQMRSPVLEMCVDHVLGLLELSLGNFAVAAWQLSRCARRAEPFGLAHPFAVRYEADLVEALVALGRRSEALRESLTLTVRAERFGTPWTWAAALRCWGMLAEENGFPPQFGAALALQSSVTQFEHARTQLLFGERLRRSRRRTDARVHLTAALTTFRQLGAAPWADRADRELAATTPTARVRGDVSNSDDLTPQEQSVVQMMVEGATVREAATRLFLSPKTVEAHLGRAYRKLGVRNRAQLAIVVARA